MLASCDKDELVKRKTRLLHLQALCSTWQRDSQHKITVPIICEQLWLRGHAKANMCQDGNGVRTYRVAGTPDRASLISLLAREGALPKCLADT
jgi:hypothetical protein